MTITLRPATGQTTRDGHDKWAAFDDNGRCVASGTYRAMDSYARTVDPTYNARRVRDVNARRNGMGVHLCAALTLTALLAAGCGADTGTGPSPIPPPIVAPSASQEPEQPVSETATDGLMRSPVNLWGKHGYQWPDGTWTPYIPFINPWK